MRGRLLKRIFQRRGEGDEEVLRELRSADCSRAREGRARRILESVQEVRQTRICGCIAVKIALLWASYHKKAQLLGELKNQIFNFFPYPLLRLSIKYRTATIIAEQAIIAIITNHFIVRNGAIGIVATGVGVSSEAGVGDTKYVGVGERRGKV